VKSFYKVLFLSILGLIIGVASIFYDNQSSAVKIEPVSKLQPPYDDYVYGTGIIETGSTNIPVGTAIPGIVTHLYIKVGQPVKVGDALFTIDERDIKEKIRVATIKVKVEKASIQKIIHQFDDIQKLMEVDSLAISRSKYLSHKDDLALANANMELAQEQLSALKKELKRHTIYSLIDGQVLQCKMRVGEYINGNRINSPLVLLGSNTMSLRVDVNENDLWRFKPETKAVAFVRSHSELKIPLLYNYTEPYIVPKTALTGLSTERTDLRVLQIIYSFEKPDFPVYIGQQLDVFIDTNKVKKSIK